MLRNVNGDYSRDVPEPDYDALVDEYNQAPNEATSCNNQPRNLSKTQYGFTTQNINGVEMRVYNDPIETSRLLIQQQGCSEFDMQGTCGLCQCSNLLTLAGVQNSTEDTIISSALHCSDNVIDCMDIFHPYSYERGGTSVRDRREILEQNGLSTYYLPISIFRRETVKELAESVQTGHGVIVSVDIARLWKNGMSGGHAISLLSVTEDGSTFIYSDTGRGEINTISANDLAFALSGRPANITTNIIR